MAETKQIEASTPYERTVHWLLAIATLMLLLTGLTMIFRSFEPISQMFGGYRQVMWIHRISGLFFTGAIVLMVQLWYEDAGYLNPSDIMWLKNAGGYMWKAEVPAPYKYNAGQKLFFLTVAIYGVVMIITGFFLWFGKGYLNATLMTWMTVFHALGVMVIGAFSMAHIYLGTIGTDESLRVMTRGKVSEEWAKTHKTGWYKEIKKSK